MNIQIKLNEVQIAELKMVMKSDRRVMTQQEVKKLNRILYGIGFMVATQFIAWGLKFFS